MEEIDPGKEICSFLEEKLSIFSQYLSITRRMMEELQQKETANLGGLVSKRQNCINRIQAIDMSIEEVIKASANKIHFISSKFKETIDSRLNNLRGVMESVALFDREILVTARAENESIKAELLRMGNVRKAMKGYRMTGINYPRFLDTMR